MRLLLLMGCLLGLISRSDAQFCGAACCGGVAVAGSANLSTLPKNTFRILISYRYNFTDAIYEGSQRSDSNFVNNANSNLIANTLAYGISNKITIETEIPYYINKTIVITKQPVSLYSRSGLSNGVVSLKYGIYNKNDIELAAAAGAKFPFTRKMQMINEVEWTKMLQPSTGAFGFVGQIYLSKIWTEKKIRLFLLHRTEINGTDMMGFKMGNFFSTSLWISKNFNSRWTGILQIRNETMVRDVMEMETIAASGSYAFILSPIINYTLAQKWNISIFTNIPIYRYYNGTQIGEKYLFALALVRDFDFSQKTNYHNKQSVTI